MIATPNTPIILGSGTAFRLRRPPALTNGFVNDIDPGVAAQLDTLHTLLTAPVFVMPTPAAQSSTGANGGGQAPDGPGVDEASESARERASERASERTAKRAAVHEPPPSFTGLDPNVVLKLALAPKRAKATDTWDPASLAYALNQASSAVTAATTAGKPIPNLITLAEYVDRVPNLSTLKYSIDAALVNDWTTISEPMRRVLDDGTYPAIRVYLVAYAFLVLGLSDPGAVENFILNDRSGASQSSATPRSARRGSSSPTRASTSTSTRTRATSSRRSSPPSSGCRRRASSPR
jgi:hypothetical protein